MKAVIETLKKEDVIIYPVTHVDAIVNDNGKVNIPTKTSLLENDSRYVTSEELVIAISQSITNTLNTEV